jgi:Flp pilus assembly protein TadB
MTRRVSRYTYLTAEEKAKLGASLTRKKKEKKEEKKKRKEKKSTAECRQSFRRRIARWWRAKSQDESVGPVQEGDRPNGDRGRIFIIGFIAAIEADATECRGIRRGSTEMAD